MAENTITLLYNGAIDDGGTRSVGGFTDHLPPEVRADIIREIERIKGKETEKMYEQYYQGDLLFQKVKDTPEPEKLEVAGYQPIVPQNGVYILARGEKTDHIHTVSTQDARLFGNRLVVLAPTQVVHEVSPRRSLRGWLHRLFSGQEALHPPLQLESGEYTVTQQRRYVRQSQPRTVID